MQTNLSTYFKDKQKEAQEFVRCVAKLHSESMCAELVPTKETSSKKNKAPPPPTAQVPQRQVSLIDKPAKDAPTPGTINVYVML